MKRESITIETLTRQDLANNQLCIVATTGDDISSTELICLIQTNQIPLIEPGKWLDERRYCCYAHEEDVTGSWTCPCWRVPEPGDADYKDGVQWSYCTLNGVERRDPCLFDLSENSPEWQEIRDYAAQVERLGGW